jgi:hypothetical protein
VTGARREELELIVDLAFAKMEILVDKKLQDYDDRQLSRRRWTIRTLLAIGGLMLTFFGLVAAKLPW